MPVSSQDDLDKATQAAKVAFKVWAKTSFEKWRTALCAWADAIEATADGFARTLTMEQGKPLSQSSVEYRMASSWIRGLASIGITENVIEETEQRKIVQRYVHESIYDEV